MKKALTLLLVVMLFASVMPAVSLAQENITIQVVVPSNVQDFPTGITEDDNFIVDYWEEKTGYNFDIVVLDSDNESQKLSVMFNSGEINGIVVSRTPAGIGTYAAQGLIANLDEYKDSSALYQMFETQNSAGMYDGSQYAFMIPDAISYATFLGLWYTNKGAMAELGYDSAPATFEEFDALMYAAKDAGYMGLAVQGDPGRGDIDGKFSLLQGMFGLGGGEYGVNESNEVYYKYITEDAKTYLEYCKKLYDDGIIPADFASQTEDGIVELLLSGKALTASSIAMWSGPSVTSQGEELGLDLRFTDYPADVNGNTSYGSLNVKYGASALCFMVSANCPYMEEAMKAIDMMCEKDVVDLANYGIEGEHYTVDAEGNKVAIEGAENIDWAVYFRNVFLPEDWYPVYGVGSDWAEYYYPAERPSVGNPNGDPVIHLPVHSEYVAKLDELRDNIVLPFYTKVVMGEETLDNWDGMVEQWTAQGGAEIMDYYTELYATSGNPTFDYASYLPADHPEYTGKYLFNGADDLAKQITAD